MNYYYSIDGTEVAGPSSLNDLKDDFLCGALPPTTKVCAEGTETWQTLDSLVKPAPKQIAQPPVLPQTNLPQTTNQPTNHTAALRKCPSCGNPVSPEADKCPHCGHPIKRGFLGKSGTERIFNVGCLIIIMVIVVLVLLGTCSRI